MMLTWAMVLSGVTAVLALLTVPTRSKKTRRLLGILLTAAALAAMGLFLSALNGSGGADFGKELRQLYVPVAVYTVFAAFGVFTLVRSRPKRNRDQD